MCGIAGFCNLESDYTKEEGKWNHVLNNMKVRLHHRGPDENGAFLEKHIGFSQVRLSIIDLVSGRQPMSRKIGERNYSIIYNGELYNTKELRRELELKDWRFRTSSDTEVILLGFIEYGTSFITRLNGIFSIAIWDSHEETLFLFRDRLGIKPLFYTVKDNTLVFGSELKVLFEFPGIKPVIDKNSLGEIFGLGPAKSYGTGVYKNCLEVLPGNYIVYNKNGLKQYTYWKLESKPHTDSYEETVEKTSYLVTDSIKRQMVSDIPICTFLSGGIDSSIVTAVCARELQKKGEQLNTFSFDFEGNDEYFKANNFQPSRDRPYVEKMVAFLNTNHTFLECTNMDLANHLDDVVDARDLPGMADVESSLLYFCKEVKKYNKVTLTGECADEIFGGYPWFHSKEAFELNTFPWSKNMEPRKQLLKDDILNEINLDAYVKEAYEKSIKETPYLDGENQTDRRRREIAYLNIKWFMVTLLDRMDRTSMYSGLEARVPLADHRLLEYVWNVPWEMKCKDNVVKHLLRESAKGIVPDEVLYRKKSPYPKTYNPHYEALLGERLLKVLKDTSSPINQLIDANKVISFLNTPSDYGTPWYGQLMAGPQLIAYMLQVNYWLDKYNVKIEL